MGRERRRERGRERGGGFRAEWFKATRGGEPARCNMHHATFCPVTCFYETRSFLV